MDYLTRPGQDLPYGNFPRYLSTGFWNPEPAITSALSRHAMVEPQQGLGSNTIKGGGFLDPITNAISAASFRPFLAQNPTTAGQDLQTAWKGQALGPGPEAWQKNWQLPPNAPIQTIPPFRVYDRNMEVNTTRPLGSP